VHWLSFSYKKCRKQRVTSLVWGIGFENVIHKVLYSNGVYLRNNLASHRMTSSLGHHLFVSSSIWCFSHPVLQSHPILGATLINKAL
jgi:hypothetical protein